MQKSQTPLGDPENSHDFEMNHFQWRFVIDYYVEYIHSPYELMNFLQKVAHKFEDYQKDGRKLLRQGNARE